MPSPIRLVLGASFLAALGVLVHAAAKEPIPEPVLATVRDLAGEVAAGELIGGYLPYRELVQKLERG